MTNAAWKYDVIYNTWIEIDAFLNARIHLTAGNYDNGGEMTAFVTPEDAVTIGEKLISLAKAMTKEEIVTIRLPLDHWEQIVSDIEDMCGSSDDIEILSKVERLDDGA